MDNIKTATVVLPAEDNKLQKGMHVDIVIYDGNNMAIAESITKYLGECLKENIPVPLHLTGFQLRVEDVIVESYPGVICGEFSTRYRIILKGELI